MKCDKCGTEIHVKTCWKCQENKKKEKAIREVAKLSVGQTVYFRQPMLGDTVYSEEIITKIISPECFETKELYQINYETGLRKDWRGNDPLCTYRGDCLGEYVFTDLTELFTVVLKKKESYLKSLREDVKLTKETIKRLEQTKKKIKEELQNGT